MSYNQVDFLEKIKESYIKYLSQGNSKSSEKLKPIHIYWADVLQDIFGQEFIYHYNSNGYRINPTIVYKINVKENKKGDPKGEAYKELNVQGKYYDKNIDVAVTNNEGNVVFCLGIKFITANYEQNSNNYFENMLGETVNIQGEGIPYAQLIIFRKHTPYYKKNEKEKIFERTEEIKRNHLNKYFKLAEESAPISPFATCLFGVDINNESNELIIDDFSENCQAPICKKVDIGTITADAEQLSVENFLAKISEKAAEIIATTSYHGISL